MKTKNMAFEIIMAAAVLIMMIGNNTWFRVCGPKDDGSFMACHWAGRMVTACAVLMLALSAVHFVSKHMQAKIALDIAMACTALMTLLVPGRIINLCMDAAMMCRTHTQPWVIGLSAVIIVAAAFDIFICRSQAEAEKHKRKQK